MNGVHQRIVEALVPKMIAHSIDNALPEFFPTLLVDRFIADHGKLVRTGRNEN